MALPAFPSLVGKTFPVKRTNLGFDVIKQQAVSGARRTRWPQRNLPVWQWSIDFDVLREQTLNGVALTEFQTLAAFYNSVYGSAYAFSYQDDLDNAVTGQSFGIGNGTATAFQLVRTMAGFTEPVYQPSGTPSIYIGGVLQAGTAYAISASGLVTFNAAPAVSAALTWTGTFNWLCRFDSDSIDFSNFMSGLWEAKGITFSNELL